MTTTPQFHPLRVLDVRPVTTDAVSVAFDVPAALRDAYRFVQGQFVTLRATLQGEELRRAYSICSSVPSYEQGQPLRVGIKRVPGGRFSNHVNDHLEPGQTLDVMTPDGRFYAPLDASQRRHYWGIAGGSGITPMLSLIATTLATEPTSHFTLIYGNRGVSHIMFASELDDLKDTYLQRFQLLHVLSEEGEADSPLHGLLNQDKLRTLLRALQPGQSSLPDHAFVCGPEPMMDAAEAVLHEMGLPAAAIHAERFGSFAPSQAAAALADEAASAELTVIIDGKHRRTRVGMPTEQGNDTVLDAGLRAGMVLPYSCKAGNCSTCRARVLEGEVHMLKNFALTPDECAAGFVLTCQCVPVSDKVTVSFDER